jgi:predicted metal-binding membrane protein
VNVTRYQSLAPAGGLLLADALAWYATIGVAHGMDVAPGTMGLGLLAFVGAWALMMAAMMLPSIVPVTALYTRTMRDHRARRSMMLALGYVGTWAATGVVAFGLARGAGFVARDAPGWAEAIAIATCVACGLYQLTPLKDRCLRHCRTPLGHLLRYSAFRGRLADVRVGFDHAAWCIACCWALMVLLVTFGVMNVVAMTAVAGVVLVEKVVAPGRWYSLAVGMAAFALAATIWFHPAFAAGLHGGTGGTGMAMR